MKQLVLNYNPAKRKKDKEKQCQLLRLKRRANEREINQMLEKIDSIKDQ